MALLTLAVLGGSGFLGRHIVHQLLLSAKEAHQEEGGKKNKCWSIKEIRVLDVSPYKPILDAPAEAGLPAVRYVECDLRDLEALTQALAGVTALVNCAAVTADLTREDLGCDAHMQEVNLGGASKVVAACRRAGVRALVHTSSVAVMMSDQRLIEHTEALAPQVDDANLTMGEYARDRRAAEGIILAASSSLTDDGQELVSVVLRVPILYGEGDRSFVPLVLRLARAGGNRIPSLGNPEAPLQAAYVGNIAEAHVCALKKLVWGEVRGLHGCGGLAMCVTDDTPPTIFPYLAAPFLQHHNFQPSHLTAYWLLYLHMLLLGILAFISALLGFQGSTSRPTYRLHQMTKTATVVSRMRATVCIDYLPPYTWEEALERANAYYTKHV